jgi:NADH-quinone oxidoreductase subunit J
VSPVLAATAAQNAELIGFIILAPLSVIAALGMVFNRNAVYSALLLVVNFFCLAVFYLLLSAQFVAAVQVIVYAGAIMVLFLFVLMLLGVERAEILHETIKGQRVAAVVLGVALLAGMAGAILTGVFQANEAGLAAANANGNVVGIGRLLFTKYTLAFEMTGVLLLVAGVGALVLGKSRPEDEQPRRRRTRTGTGDPGPLPDDEDDIPTPGEPVDTDEPLAEGAETDDDQEAPEREPVPVAAKPSETEGSKA